MRTTPNTIFLSAVLICINSGCAGSPKESPETTTQNAKEAISQSQSISGTQAKINFLVKEAKGFLAKDKFQQGGLIAEYILDELNGSSPEAVKIQRAAYKELQKSLTQ